VEEMLSLRSQIFVSLAEESEAVEEARPHAEWSGPVVLLGTEMECSIVVSLYLRARRSGVQLEGDRPVVEELVLLSHVVGVVFVCGVHFDVLCTNCYSFLYIAVFLLLFFKNSVRTFSGLVGP
jgi:hypothetical protein